MKIHLAILASLFLVPAARAGGSLGWTEVCQRLTEKTAARQPATAPEPKPENDNRQNLEPNALPK